MAGTRDMFPSCCQRSCCTSQNFGIALDSIQIWTGLKCPFAQSKDIASFLGLGKGLIAVTTHGRKDRIWWSVCLSLSWSGCSVAMQWRGLQTKVYIMYIYMILYIYLPTSRTNMSSCTKRSICTPLCTSVWWPNPVPGHGLEPRNISQQHVRAHLFGRLPR